MILQKARNREFISSIEIKHLIKKYAYLNEDDSNYVIPIETLLRELNLEVE